MTAVNLDYLSLSQLGCSYIEPTVDPRTTWPVPQCACTELHADSLYCDAHYPIVYREGTGLRLRRKEYKAATLIWDIASDFDAVCQELALEESL